MYTLLLHKNLTPEKWASYPLSQQVLTIANELNRARNCLDRNYPGDAEKCYERAMELTDLTVEDSRWRSKLKELLRFREVLSELYIAKDPHLNALCLRGLLSFNAEAWNLLAIH